jgi:hypothetical protein
MVLAPPTIEDGDLVWGGINGWIEYRAVVPDREILAKFLRLADKADQDLREFAAKWGMLFPEKAGIMKDNQLNPITLPGPVLASHFGTGAWPEGEYREGLEEWRAWARRARIVLRIASKLHKGEPGDREDWEVLYPDFAGSDFVWPLQSSNFPAEVVAKPGEVLTPEVEAQNRQLGYLRATLMTYEWIRLSDHMDIWIQEGDVRPLLALEGATGARLAIGGHGLMGALATQLLFATSRAYGFAECTHCGYPYTPARAPREGERRFCQDCRKEGSDQRYTKRDHQRLMEKARQLRAQGRTINEIARALDRTTTRIKGWLKPQKSRKPDGRASKPVRRST